MYSNEPHLEVHTATALVDFSHCVNVAQDDISFKQYYYMLCHDSVCGASAILCAVAVRLCIFAFRASVYCIL
jgi:hypothetical protein